MSAGQILGLAPIASPFLLLFAFSVKAIGWLETLGVFIGSAVVMAVIAVGCALVNGGAS